MLLAKKIKTSLVILLLILTTTFVLSQKYQQTCTASEIKDALRKALFEYFESPTTSKLSVNEIKDFLHFYISTSSNQLTVDCSGSGPLSGKPYYLMLGAVRDIERGIPKCNDGTEYGSCSNNKPLYCYGGQLIKRCDLCGCPSGICKTEGKSTQCVEQGRKEPDKVPPEKPTAGKPSKIEIIRITTNSADQGNPAIYGDKIVWQDHRNGYNNADIYMYDLSTKQEIQITKNTADQKYPAIYGDKIVWSDTRNGNYDVFMHDLSTGKETQITTSPVMQLVSSIYDDKIAWYTHVPYNSTTRSSSDIYMYNLATGQETPITTSPGSQYYPLIYGNKIVWTDTRNGFQNEDIYMYDLATGQETPITTAQYYQFLSDFDGNRIAWLDSRKAGAKAIYEIYTYDLSTRQEALLPVNVTYSLWDPAIYGDKIVWYDYRSSLNYANIYMYDFSTGKETQIDPIAAFQWDPDIYENKIVWADNRNVGYGGDIYLAIIS